MICSAGCTACIAGKRQVLSTPTPKSRKRENDNLFDKRNLIEGDNIQGTYEDVKGSSDTVIVPHDTQGASGISSSKFIDFADKDAYLYVEALVGCTSVIVVSQQGAWMSHLW